MFMRFPAVPAIGLRDRLSGAPMTDDVLGRRVRHRPLQTTWLLLCAASLALLAAPRELRAQSITPQPASDATPSIGNRAKPLPTDFFALAPSTPQPAWNATPSIADSAKPPPTDFFAQAPGSAVTLETIDVQGEGGSLENVPMLQQVPTVALTGTKVEDLPLNVKVVPVEVVTQQGGTQLSDALRNVSGVSTGGQDSIGSFDRFVIRGMDARMYTDGFSDGEQVNGIPHSLNGVQSIEVVKGPGSALLGNGPPGGSINVTHFAPSSTFAAGAGVQYGSFNTLNSNYWLTGPTAVNGIDYRIDATVAHSDGFRSLKSADYELRPVLTWALNEHFLTFSVDMRHIIGTPDTYGLIYVNGHPIDVANNTKFSTPFSYSSQNYIRTELSDAWKISNFLTLNNRFSYLYRDAGILRNNDSGTVVGDMFTGRAIRMQYDTSYDFDYIFEPVWKFHTGEVNHTLVTGFEAEHEHLFTDQSDAVLPNITDIFAPIIPETSVGNLNFTRSGSRGLEDSLTADYLSIYAIDQIDVTDKLKLRFSGRENWWDTTLTPDVFVPGRVFQGNQLFEPGVNYSRADQPFDWSAGILYRILPGVSPYFGVSESHLANFSSEATSAGIEAPESALQYEVGVKLGTDDGRFQFTASAFNVDRQNVFTLVNDEPNFSSQLTRGLESDITLAITPAWKIMANATIQQAVLTGNPSAPTAVGNVPIGVPLRLANLWTTYDLDFFGTKGFTVGAGVQYKGEIFGDQFNMDKVPGYVIFDANLTYKQPKWSLSVGMKNIANTLYFTAANGAGAFVGDPRTAYIKAEVRF
jgi:iron complex outermembrane recepter protein